MSLPSDPVFYIVAIVAVVLVGLAKGGFAGLGAASMPLMALVMDPIAAAAILLPLLIVQDVVGVWSFRKTFDARTLAITIPGGLVGTILGWALATSVSVAVVEGAVGLIALLFGANRLMGLAGHGLQASKQQPEYIGFFWGSAAGFAGQIALAGGPPFQIWMMSRKFTRDVFVGTSAIFFAVINWFKVPAFYALGQFSWANAQLTLVFLPVAIASTFAGVWLVRRISPDRFLLAINLLMVVVGAKLLWNALIAQ